MRAVSHVTFTFQTSHHALWAEDLARERKIAAEIVPAPPGEVAACGLALRVPQAGAPEVESACREEGIQFTRTASG